MFALSKLQKNNGALDSQPQVIKITRCLPMVGGSPGTPASSTSKTGRHDIDEYIAESGVKHNKSINIKEVHYYAYITTVIRRIIIMYTDFISI